MIENSLTNNKISNLRFESAPRAEPMLISAHNLKAEVSAATPRVSIIADLIEEGWTSMDFVADILYKHLIAEHSESFSVAYLRPAMRVRFGRKLNGKLQKSKADLALNRYWDYPMWLRLQRKYFDIFHIADHSYAQLVHVIPSERTIVTCHDIDAFTCLTLPLSRRHKLSLLPYIMMSKRTLSGLRRAARITCDSVATRDALLKYDLAPTERLVVVPLGVHPTCSPEIDESAETEAENLLGAKRNDTVEILNVGSTIPRKRIDLLLQIFARVRKELPHARLVRVGGSFTDEQKQLARHLDLEDAIVQLPFITRETLAAIYRRAAIVVQPTEAEGFGFPNLEAMACGTPVVTSDIPVLREVGENAATYLPVGDITKWATTILELLDERWTQSEKWERRRRAGIAQAQKYSWSEFARKMAIIYRELLQ